MKYFKLFIKIVLIIASLYGVGRFIVVYYDSTVIDERQPYLQQKTSHSIKIKWITPESEIGSVEYMKEGDTKALHVKENEPTRFHSIVLPKLQEHTKYSYKVHADSLHVDNTKRHFITQYATSEDVLERVWIIGDSGEVGKRQDEVFTQAMKYFGSNPIDFWLLLGDNAYRSGTQKQYNTTLFKPYAPLIKTNVPWAVNGNHDARRFAFYDIFDMPETSDNEQYFSVEGANIHFVLLDSHDGDTSKDGDMATWLKKDLSQNKKMWTVVAFHHPPYSKGGHDSDDHFNSGGRMQDMRENILPILEKYGVDLVLSGHSHAYERSSLMHNHFKDSNFFDASRNLLSNKRTCYTKSTTKIPGDGTIYLVIGSSAKLDTNNPLNHKAMPYSFEKMGSVVLEVSKDHLNSKFLGISGDIIDEFSIYKDLLSTCQDAP